LSGASRLLAVSALGALVVACTLTRTSVDSCTTNADCRAAFGSGRVCASDGICEVAPPNPRCTQTFPADLLTRPESYPNVLVFGALVVNGIASQAARGNATRLAATQINEQGGLDGRLFGVVFCDVNEDPKYDSLKRTDAVIQSGKYLADVIGAPAFVGPSASGDVLALFKALQADNRDVLVMSPSATSPELTTAEPAPTDDKPGLLWRTAVPDTLQGAAIAQYLDAVTMPAPVTNVVVIEEKGAYGDGLEAVFRQSFQKDGRTIRTIPFTAGNTSERDAATLDAASGNPQYVLFFSSQSPDESAFVTSANASGKYAAINVFLSDTAANADLLKNTATASGLYSRITGSRPAVPAGPVYDLFKISYTGAFKDDPSAYTFVPHAYDGTWLVFYGSAYALRREGKVTGSGISRGLRHIVATGDEIQVRPDSWKKVADELAANHNVNVTGASGKLDYNPATEETTGIIDIWKIAPDGMSIQTLTTIEPR